MKIKQLFIDIYKDKKKLVKFLVLFTSVSVLLVISFIGITYATSRPQFCATCHIMKPEFATWQASSHSQVDCVACHVDPGLGNALKHKVVATKELYDYVTKSYELPIQMTEEIPDDRCLQCHSLDRKVSPSSDLYIPHEKHYEQGIACTKCHQGVAHGKVASRGMTMGGDFNDWDKDTGTKVMTTEFTEPKMDLCMDCHGRRGITVSCDACHSNNMMPSSHRETSFKTEHGKQAKKNVQYCDTCHAYIEAPGVTSKNMPEEEDVVAKYLNSMKTEADSDTGYADYAKNNPFCVECHKKRPVSHDNNWPTEHGKAADKDSNSCLICHSPRTDVKGTTSKAACSSCHPSIHKDVPWRKSHPIKIPDKYPVLEAKCFQCHVKSICASCHRVSPTNVDTANSKLSADNNNTKAKVTIKTTANNSNSS